MFRKTSITTFLLPLLVWGCSADDHALQVGETGSAADSPGEAVSTRSEQLTLSKAEWCKVVDTLTAAADIVLDADIDPWCYPREAPQLYYFGSSPTAESGNGMPRRTGTGLYCALDGSHDAKNSALVGTRVGQFGTRSRFRVTKRDTDGHNLSGQLIGDTYVFGASFPLSVQDLKWSYKRETQDASGLPDHYGYYADLASEGIDFGFNAEANFMAGPVPVTVKLSFDNDTRHLGYENNRFAPLTPHTSAFSYSALAANCGTCIGCTPCPTAAEQQGHALACSGGCTATYFRELDDKILPYSGPFGGARADFLYRIPNVNSWQLGYPDGTRAYDGEPRFTLGTRSGYDTKYTTKFRVEVIGKYDAGPATVKAGVIVDHRNRNGMAIRENEALGGQSEFSRETQVWTELSAETAIGVNAWLSISIPLFGTYKASYFIVDPEHGGSSKPSSANGVKIRWNSDHTGDNNYYLLYAKGSANQDPEDAIDACLDSAKDQNRSRTPPTTGREFMEKVHEAARENVFPCNVKICQPTGEGPTGGRLTTCVWNASALDLECTETGRSCNVADTKADMCDSNGDPIPRQTTCQPCRTDAHCGSSQLMCLNGCCTDQPR